MTAETQPGEIGAIVRSLTPKQREAILDHGEEYRRLCEGMGRGSAAERLFVIRPLEGIFEKAWDCDANRYRLSPLGLRVRAALVEGGADAS